MDAPYSPLEFQLLNDWQRDFPLLPRPFAALGAKVRASETAVLATLTRLAQRGAISRVGAVLAPRRVGASTLAALAAPPARLEEIAALVSARAEVNHNYQREHRYNLWFVVTAADEAALAATLAAIEADTGCGVLSLPLRQEFHIDLGFDLGLNAGPHSQPRRHGNGAAAARRELDATEIRLIAALQPGLALVRQPYALLAEHAGLDEDAALGYLRAWQEEGLVKRMGVVVRHHELGYRANAMTVFDLPDDQVDAIGRQLAREAGVTLCYRRERCLPDWPYNLYCMVHGRSREAVQPIIARLEAIAGRQAQALFSVHRFKQCGARYFAAAA